MILTFLVEVIPSHPLEQPDILLLAAAESNKVRGMIAFCQLLSVLTTSLTISLWFKTGIEVLLQFLIEFGYWESKEVIQVNTQP